MKVVVDGAPNATGVPGGVTVLVVKQLLAVELLALMLDEEEATELIELDSDDKNDEEEELDEEL